MTTEHMYQIAQNFKELHDERLHEDHPSATRQASRQRDSWTHLAEICARLDRIVCWLRAAVLGLSTAAIVYVLLYLTGGGA